MHSEQLTTPDRTTVQVPRESHLGAHSGRHRKTLIPGGHLGSPRLTPRPRVCAWCTGRSARAPPNPASSSACGPASATHVMAAASPRLWSRLLGRCSGHLTRLRAEETHKGSRCSRGWAPRRRLLKKPGPSASSPPPSLPRHAVGEDLQTAPHLRWVPRAGPGLLGGWGSPGPGGLKGRGGGPRRPAGLKFDGSRG